MFRKISFNTTLRLINCGEYRIREHRSFYPPNAVGIEIRFTSITARRERKSKIQCFNPEIRWARPDFRLVANPLSMISNRRPPVIFVPGSLIRLARAQLSALFLTPASAGATRLSYWPRSIF